MEEHAGLIRAYGVRELATGVGILSQDDPTPWVWGRVAGDALDLATLAAGLRGDNPRQENAAMALMAVAGVTLLDVICARSLGADGGRSDRLPTMRDYRHRSGMPRPPEALRGAAARDFEVPRDMRPPEALRAYASG
ncbi:MAG TPA: hypothetical protein VFY87_06775 [Geminicoccaceae bacterium]|nr:hypothetical protein [Geminicoccaceae bacterium]